jgi:hypothetical protein
MTYVSLNHSGPREFEYRNDAKKPSSGCATTVRVSPLISFRSCSRCSCRLRSQLSAPAPGWHRLALVKDLVDMHGGGGSAPRHECAFNEDVTAVLQTRGA